MYNKLKLVGVVSIAFLLHACMTPPNAQVQLANSVDPVNSLHSYEISQKYTHEFWAAHKRKNTEIWRYALQFCNGHPEYPNCYTVFKVHETVSFDPPAAKPAAKKKKATSSKSKSANK